MYSSQSRSTYFVQSRRLMVTGFPPCPKHLVTTALQNNKDGVEKNRLPPVFDPRRSCLLTALQARYSRPLLTKPVFLFFPSSSFRRQSAITRTAMRWILHCKEAREKPKEGAGMEGWVKKERQLCVMFVCIAIMIVALISREQASNVTLCSCFPAPGFVCCYMNDMTTLKLAV